MEIGVSCKSVSRLVAVTTIAAMPSLSAVSAAGAEAVASAVVALASAGAETDPSNNALIEVRSRIVEERLMITPLKIHQVDALRGRH